MINSQLQEVDLWRKMDLTRSKKKPAAGSYEEDIENLNKTIQKGVKLI